MRDVFCSQLHFLVNFVKDKINVNYKAILSAMTKKFVQKADRGITKHPKDFHKSFNDDLIRQKLDEIIVTSALTNTRGAGIHASTIFYALLDQHDRTVQISEAKCSGWYDSGGGQVRAQGESEDWF